MGTHGAAQHVTTADDGIHELVEHRLRQGDLRYTAGRRAIVELLKRRGQAGEQRASARPVPQVPRSRPTGTSSTFKG